MSDPITPKLPGLLTVKESSSHLGHSVSNQVALYSGKLFRVIGLKELYQGIYKEAYLNKDYKMAISMAGKGFLKFALSSVLVAGGCFAAMSRTEVNFSKISGSERVPLLGNEKNTTVEADKDHFALERDSMKERIFWQDLKAVLYSMGIGSVVAPLFAFLSEKRFPQTV